MLHIGTPAAQSDPPRRRGEAFCLGCRNWFPNDLRACPDPECGRERPAHNPRLRKAILDNHLFDQANAARG